MPINVNASNYINTQTNGSGSSQAMTSSVSSSSDGAIVSVKGLDLQVGQTLSGQIVEIDGKDIKLLLSNNQTINAKLEGNINALLGQTLSFEVKNSENGQTALRPLYTNLNNSQTVTAALQNAGLPVTKNYAQMVSSMMDESMPINKNAIYSMAKQINTFPNANPDTVVKLNKLGLQINELTINQYENYKGFEHKIIGDVDKLSTGLTDLMKDSLSETLSEINGNETASKLGEALKGTTAFNSTIAEGKNLLSAFFNAITGANSETANEVDEVNNNSVSNDLAENNAADDESALNISEENNAKDTVNIPKESFDVSRQVLDLIDTESIDVNESVSDSIKKLAKEVIDSLKFDIANSEAYKAEDTTNNIEQKSVNTRESIISQLLASSESALTTNETDSLLNTAGKIIEAYENSETSNLKNTLTLAKDILSLIDNSKDITSDSLKTKLTSLLSDKDFLTNVKNSINKQMLLKPEEVVNSKNIDYLYSKITKQAMQAIEILQSSGKDNPQLLNSARNISDNVTFMNELNQVVTYVQLPLLMNNKSAHGDLYVYTNKKSLKDNDGNISALLHLDMDNLGPMDIYVALTNKTKLNTHFYLKDEATIDFIEEHIDYLNRRLTDKGYDMNVDVSVKDTKNGSLNMADEFMKDDPAKVHMSASKFSFDVRA